jgi:hypothetical protein
MRQKGRLHVLEHGQTREDVGPLERAPDAETAEIVRRDARDVAPVELHVAAIGPKVARDQVEQGRLAGAVGPDDRGDAGARDVQAHAADGHEAVEDP